MGYWSSQTSSNAAQPTFTHSALIAIDRVDNRSTATAVKTVVGGTSLVTFLLGLRSAWKHSRQPEAADLARAQILSGVGFAGKALAVATVITVSGFSLLIVGATWLLNVNTPRQFGSAMRSAFGERFRLPQSAETQSFEDFIRSIEQPKADTAVTAENQSNAPPSTQSA